MPGYIALPAYRAPSALDFTGLNEGIDEFNKQFEKNRLLRQAQAVGAALVPDTQTTPNPLMAQPSYAAQPSPGAQANATNATDFLKQQEGYAPVAQWDVRQNSGGYGSKAAPGETFTPAKAEQYLRRDMAPVENWLNTNAPNLSPGQRTALTSFGYNLGVDDLERLKPDIQAGNWARLSDRMKSFNKSENASGQLEVNPGLVNRRGREAALVLPPPPYQDAPAPAPSGPNYRAAAAKAFEFGNVALGTQLLQQQQELDNQTYTRGRQARQEATAQQQWQAGHGLQVAQNTRAEASAGREAQTFADAQEKALGQQFGAIAQTIANVPDPAQRQALFARVVAADPRIEQHLAKYGVPKGDADTGIKFLIAEAQGLTTGKGEYGLVPIPGEDPEGNPVFYQPSKAGGPAKKIQFGEGFKPKDIADKAADKELGKLSADAQKALPAAKTSVDDAVRMIDKLRTHPGLDAATGLSGTFDPRNYIPGSDAFNFNVLNKQVVAKTFMGAREGLKGAGQVTDFEGGKGQDAIGRLATAQSKKEYLEALDDVERLMKASYSDLEKKAGMSSKRADQPAAQGGGDVKKMTDDELRKALGL